MSTDKLTYYAKHSEWIESKSREEAIKEYRKKHPRLATLYTVNDVKILSESARLLNNIRDSENGYVIAIEAMNDYLEANPEQNV